MIMIMFHGLKVMNSKIEYITMLLNGNTAVPSAQCCSMLLHCKL